MFLIRGYFFEMRLSCKKMNNRLNNFGAMPIGRLGWQKLATLGHGFNYLDPIMAQGIEG